MTLVDGDSNQPVGNYGRQDQADYGAPVDETEALTEGPDAAVVRTYLRPLLPGGYDVERYTSAMGTERADAAGAVTVVLPEPLPGYIWLVDRIGLVASTGGWAAVVFYVGPATMRRLVDVADAGGPNAIADQASPIVVGAGLPLTAVGSGMPVGAELTVHAQYRLARAL